jgi:membrane associated rhomboid family serine protease
MLPLRDANPTHRAPILTIVIIAANVAAFLFWQPTFASGEQGSLDQQTFFWCHAAIPFEVSHQVNLASGGAEARAAIDRSYGEGFPLQRFLQSECPNKNWAQSVFVAMFLHGGWLHIGGNMLFLWVFGNNVEERLGMIRYLLFYLAGGVAAFALQLLLDPGSAIPTLGASGAIAAVLGAYIVMYPRARVLTLVIFFFITLLELPAYFVLGIWFVLQLFSGVGQIGSEVNGGVAYWAHVGGFAFGLLVGFLLRRPGRRGGSAFESVPPPIPF